MLLYLKKTLWVCFACLMAGFLAFSAFAMQDFLLVLALAAAFLVDSSMFEGLLPAVMEQLSLFERFNTFVNGVFDVTAIVYYLSVIGFFLLLSVQSMEKRRYN